MKWFTTLSALVLAAAAVGGDAAQADTDAEDIETSDTSLDIERLEGINDLTAQVWQKMRAEDSGGSQRSLRRLNSSLRRTVWEYNRLREELCNERFVVEQSCGAPFIPKWALDPKRNAMTLRELDARQSDLNDRVYALWKAACARLEKVISLEDSRPYCSIE